MLTCEDVARHWALKPATVRAMIRAGALKAVSIGKRHRIGWDAVWACEAGRSPTGAAQARYRTPLLTKADLAASLSVSVRTVERWSAEGLPTRSVGANVRFNAHDARRWLARRFGVDPGEIDVGRRAG